MTVGPVGTKALRATSGPEFIARALRQAQLEPQEIGRFGSSTPLAWFAALASQAISIEPERMNNLFPSVGNVGLPFTWALGPEPGP